MSVDDAQLWFEFAPEADMEMPRRREPREDAVRIVEYVPFPRVASERRTRVGFTRDLSARGMCLGVDEPEPLGALLRVCVRGLDGRIARVVVARVTRCDETRDGRHWLGLDLVSEAEARPAAA